MSLAIDIGIAKTHKYATRESGDSAEVVERPGGGLSAIIVDGQGSGPGARALSMQLTSRAVGLLKDGVRDGAVARAVHDSLFAYRQGKVQATLDILSVDLKTKTIVATRNAATPLVMTVHGETEAIASISGPIGLYHFTRPSVAQFPLSEGLRLVAFTDGIAAAGRRAGNGDFDVAAFVAEPGQTGLGAAALADTILAEALKRDTNRPSDDMTVAVVGIVPAAGDPAIRRLSVGVPMT